MSSSEFAPSVRVSSPTKITSTFYGPGSDSYSPYTPNGDIDKGMEGDFPRPPKRPQTGPQPRVLSFYRSISWILGFRDKYSLLNCFIWGGALVGFCLARSPTLNPGWNSESGLPYCVDFAIQDESPAC
ncbi:hypothetical protein B0H16DRAFT_531776 [Mycena metata]|uniref:Uncharacterized protein n=1 Tax=Mycena metata TaxID=1033252 RepID=A0AAD7MF79_9AGAR|nr:hypothetical protein B0H16DRAFT_531776 [Mycena metata]